MLTLVRPAPAGQAGGDPPKGRRSRALSLTDTEGMHLRAALRGLRAIHGGWKPLAAAMGLSLSALQKIGGGQRNGSPAVVLLAARVARTTVDRLLAGGPMSADRCPTCGACRGGAR
ncbi:MAG: transcriptional regulator [Polyangiaceae bacterium]|nr:transcriptional regulator [Polyangiaceae bacterium]